ncbi:MAG TPA: hypothetical protein VNH22_09945 [Blastocatellia bacterium]|jgi:hypothetical protein|nr:hypothetical protein [Blastocatellia bacterium]
MKHKNYTTAIFLAACVSATSLAALGQEPAPAREKNSCPMHKKHMAEARDRHMHELNERGNSAMGFDQAKTTHHFRLLRDGGAIEVGANDPRDRASMDQIRQHLEQISGMFAAGDFSTPFAVHARTPDGVSDLERLKAAITYRYEETAGGGRVRISSGDPKALAAIHEFLRFQIEDHRTGDPLEVSK